MPRTADPAVRERLVDAAIDLLGRGEEISVRQVAADAATSTMAVYTHFDGMPGLWLAVRERSFGTLATRLRDLEPSGDAVADLIASGAAYVDAALGDRTLFLALFEVRRTETQPAAAASTFAVLIGAVERAITSGRLHPDTDPVAAATRFWAMTHGILVLVCNGALAPSAPDEHLPSMYAAQLVALGDDRRRAEASTTAGWATRAVPTAPGRSEMGEERRE